MNTEPALCADCQGRGVRFDMRPVDGRPPPCPTCRGLGITPSTVTPADGAERAVCAVCGVRDSLNVAERGDRTVTYQCSICRVKVTEYPTDEEAATDSDPYDDEAITVPIADWDAMCRFEVSVREALSGYGSRRLSIRGAIHEVRAARNALDSHRTGRVP